jgi:hypothetical protein
VSIVLQLQELRKFLEGTNQAAKGVEHVGTQSQVAGKRAASEWVGVLNERNISVRTFQVGLKTTAKAMETARLGTAANTAQLAKLREQYRLTMLEGGKKAPAALLKLQKQMDTVSASGEKVRKTFADIGVTQADLRKGNTGEVLMKIADALHNTRSAAERSALATTLLGRAGVQLLPLLSKGSDAIQGQLDIQKQYGNYLKGNGIDSLAQLIEKERELHAAQEGMKIQLGLALLPAMQAFTNGATKLSRLIAPLTKNVWLFYGALAAVTGILIVLKVAMVVATLATAGLTATMLIWIGVVALIIVAVAALAVGFYLLYTRVTWFRNAVNDVFNWIKNNWPLLIALLVAPIVGIPWLVFKYFGGTLKSYLLGIVAFVRRIVDNLLSYIASIPKRIGGMLRKIPGANLAIKAAGGVTHAAGGVLGAIPHAAGGIVKPGETSLVGEAGPELLTAPGGSRITPLAGLASGGYIGEVVVPVYLDGREIARSVARIAADKAARR